MLLAELANKEELSIEKFCNLSAYKELEKNAGLIKKDTRISSSGNK